VASAWVRAIRPGRNGQTGRMAIRQARRHGRDVVGSSPFRVGRSWKRVSVAVYAAGPGSRIEVRLLAGLRHGQRLQVDHVKVLGSVGRVAPAPRPRSSAPMALPAKVVALYYMMWGNSGSPRLRSIPAGVNVVNLAFLQGDRPSIVGWGAQGQRSFLADARALRARGVRIVASVGGGGGQVNIADRRGFIAGVMALNAKLPLDGLDWDLERTAMGASDVVYISKRLKQLRGPAFSITMAPNGSNIDHYRAVAVQLQRARALNLIGQQFYDAVVSPQAAKGRIDQLVRAGIPPSRISIGMMVGPTSHYWTVDESVTAVRHIKGAYPGVRGGYLWESSRTGTADWVHRVGALLRRCAAGLTVATSGRSAQPDQARATRSAASPARWPALAREAVAAGEGALSPCIESPSPTSLKSSTIAPSASRAWARTPEGPKVSWWERTSGT
jgi:hypothetical protein